MLSARNLEVVYDDVVLALSAAYLAFYLGADVTALARSRVRAAPPEAEAPAPSVDTRK